MTSPEPQIAGEPLPSSLVSIPDSVETSAHGERTLPSPREIRTREIVGIPIAMTDYERAMDVMDGMIARGERGYVCAVAVHAVM
ncbi:MAG: hypothetical protein QOJ14_773, partial [Thermoleophilaceae bacterium]|nr:hypothetical protein [Thermoleophilaceae bacterium]